jgi:hypothetical protein
MKYLIYYFWMLHYSLVKKIFRKRRKSLKKSTWNLAFLCICLLFISVGVFIANKISLRSLITSKVTLAPIGGLVAVIILIPILFLLSGPLTHKKISVLRRVVKKTQNIKYFYSVLYVCFYLMLYIISFATLFSTRPT